MGPHLLPLPESPPAPRGGRPPLGGDSLVATSLSAHPIQVYIRLVIPFQLLCQQDTPRPGSDRTTWPRPALAPTATHPCSFVSGV